MNAEEWKKLTEEERKQVKWRDVPTLNKWGVYSFGFVIMFVVFIIVIGLSGGGEPDPANAAAAVPEQTTEQRDSQQLSYLQSLVELSGLGASGDESIENIKIVLALIDTYAKWVLQADTSSNPEIKALGKKAKANLAAIQKKEFPMLRKAFSRSVRETLWEEDIEVAMSGKNITLTGVLFAANKNIKVYQESLYNMYEALRYNRVQYRWVEGADYTYYDMKPPKDTEIVRID